MPHDPLSLPQDASLFLLGHVFPSAQGPLTAVSMDTLELQWFNPESVSDARLPSNGLPPKMYCKITFWAATATKKNQATFFFPYS